VNGITGPVWLRLTGSNDDVGDDDTNNYNHNDNNIDDHFAGVGRGRVV